MKEISHKYTNLFGVQDQSMHKYILP